VFSFLPKGDRALRRDESNTKLSEVRVASCSLFLYSVDEVSICNLR
jgi:hypothetical protein